MLEGSDSLSGYGLSKTLGSQAILQDVAISLERRRLVAILGPSGAGKSTLLRCLSMVEKPDSGTIFLAGQRFSFPLEPGAASPRPWPRVTVVFQQLFLWPHLRGLGNVELPLLNRWPAGEARRRAERSMDALGVHSVADRLPGQMSHGERQRVAVARAIALEPEFLLLDEITSALDVENVATILSCLERLREQGMGIGLVTHHLGFAKRAADEVIFMDCGRVLARGPMGALENHENARVARFLRSLKEGTA